MKKLLKQLTVLLIVLAVFICNTAVAALADEAYSFSKDNATVSLQIPSGFISYSIDDIGSMSATDFKSYPVTKNEAIKRTQSGTIINAFSKDKSREIDASVIDSDNITSYTKQYASSSSTEKSSNESNLLSKINNLSALDETECQSFIMTLTNELKEQGHTFLSSSSVIKLSGYKFIKTCARIGTSKSGYTYTSVMTIVGGKCYQLTCYDNSPILTQEQIDANEEIISSFKLKIKGDSGEIAKNNFTSVLAFIMIVASLALIVGICISFVKPIVRRIYGEQLIIRKRK